MNMQWSNRTKCHDDTIFTVKGDHEGKKLGDIPDRYWRWFIAQPWAKTKYRDFYEYGKLVENED